MEKLQRRRFLTDALALGGVLLGAAVLTGPRPFWSHFLEGQSATPTPSPASPPPPLSAVTPTPGNVTPPKEVPDVTEAYPSDSDMHAPRGVTTTPARDSDRVRVRATSAYPSDSDMELTTQAYPSDSDMHGPRGRVPSKKEHSLLPLWLRLS